LCGTPSETPITASTTWTIGWSSDACTYWLQQYVDSPSPTWFETDYWYYWEYVPLASATDPVAFEYGGLSWTYSGEGSLATDPGPIYPCDPGHVCTD